LGGLCDASANYLAEMDTSRSKQERFPRRYTLFFGIPAVALIVGGFLLWLPAADGNSTARSDLGLSLLGGGLALLSGFVVSLVVFIAQRRIDRALRDREQTAELAAQQRAEHAERENLKMTLSMTTNLRGVDLHGRDLRGAFFQQKDLRDADLRQADLRESRFGGVTLTGALLNDADLRGATLGTDREYAGVSMIDADLTGADLRGATIRSDIRRAVFDSADLRGADLSKAVAVHPHPENVSEHEVDIEAAVFDGALYDEWTSWPEGVDPDEAGAVRATDSEHRA
jgi:uncharacterized protein YjbI with pentapeptide repeats